jgi:hypothetical protein
MAGRVNFMLEKPIFCYKSAKNAKKGKKIGKK